MKKFIYALVFVLSLGMVSFAADTGGLVAVKTDEGVFLSWNMTGEGDSYTIYHNGEAIKTTTMTNYVHKGADGTGQYNLEGKAAVSVWENQYLEIPIEAPKDESADPTALLKKADISPNMAIGQSWTIYTFEDGACVFINGAGQVMDVNAQAVTAGGKVGTYAYNNGDNQKFFLEEADGGYVIKGKQSNLYLSVSAEGNVTIEDRQKATVFAVSYVEATLSEAEINTAKLISGNGIIYNANDAGVGDLDGDGELEIVLKWDPSDSKDASNNGKTGKVYIDAYKLNGTRLWRIDLGRNIRAGAHDTQFVVYDLDNDGCAEVAFRTADGTVDGEGNVIGDSNAIWTDNWSGKNLEGPLYLTVFEGKTGKALDTVPYDPNNNEPSTLIFGDNYGNRSERYNACVAYLDGENPYMVFQRGYYGGRSDGPGRTVLAAYSFKNGKIEKYWRFDTMDEGNEKYIGQGNHNISVGDCDNDGKDEIFLGSLTIDHDGKVLWCSHMGHGDAMHLGDFDPNRSGLEFFEVHEGQTEAQKYGFTVFDAATGGILAFREAGKDTGRGLIGNIGPFGGSYVAWAGSGAGKINSLDENIDGDFNSMNFRIYWDGDLYDELLDGTSIFKINEEGHQERIFDAGAEGCASNNSTKSNPCLQADLFGDWREEVIWRTADNTSLRIYTTTIPTAYSIMPLMTDHVYRMGIVWQNSSYNQPPHLGYYLGGDITLKIDSKTARLNGQLRSLDAPARIENDRTLVPLRFIAEAMGAKVEYDNGVITVSTPEKTIVMQIGSVDYTLNNEPKTMETMPVIVNDRTLVPVRVIGEALGMKVTWDSENRLVRISRFASEETEGIDMTSFEKEIIAQSTRKENVKIFIASDSTAQSYGDHMAPQAGWGQMLHLFFDDSVTVENRGMAGRSLKSFFNEGRWGSILDSAEEGDYVVIQFGHNDGAWNKPERYISHEDFTKMLEEEYIQPALQKGLKPIIATQTQSHWFGADGKIGEPDPNEVSYASLLRDAAKAFDLPLLEINGLSRELENRLGAEESEKLHLYAEPGIYSKYPDGVKDNTHFSYCGAFEIARIAAEEMNQIPDLKERRDDGYKIIRTFNGEQTIDLRQWSRIADEYAVSIYAKSPVNVTIDGETVLTKSIEPRVTAKVKSESGKIVIASDGEITVEAAPVMHFEPQGGINGEYRIDIPDGAYDFTFTKSDNRRGSIFINSNLVGANVDMYGTVSVPQNTEYTFKDFNVENGADIKVEGLTSSLKSVDVTPSPSIFPNKTRIYVAGDSTLCYYYPIIPQTVEKDIEGGTIRTGWAQLLDRYVSDDYSVINLASSGDWARNWRDVTFPTVLKEAREGDIFIIQFGINDRNRDDKTKTTMQEALSYMVTECQKAGIIPVLVKPQPSVGYSWGNAGEFERPNGNNGGFFNVVKTVADDTGCLFIDLNALAGDHFAEVGRDYVARNYQLWNKEANEMSDKLHISFAGAKAISGIFSAAAEEEGIFECDGYDEVTEIKNDVYLFENGTKAKLVNIGKTNKTITVVRGETREEFVLTHGEEINLTAFDSFEVM